MRVERAELARDDTRFFVSTGPAHSHWFPPAETVAFARELRALGLPVQLRLFPTSRGEWRDQLDAGLTWALQPLRLSRMSISSAGCVTNGEWPVSARTMRAP